MAERLASTRESTASVAEAVAVDISSTDYTVSPTSRALYIGVTGDVKVDMEQTGSGITFKAVPVGLLPIRVKKVYKTGTTATNILSLY